MKTTDYVTATGGHGAKTIPTLNADQLRPWSKMREVCRPTRQDCAPVNRVSGDPGVDSIAIGWSVCTRHVEPPEHMEELIARNVLFAGRIC